MSLFRLPAALAALLALVPEAWAQGEEAKTFAMTSKGVRIQASEPVKRGDLKVQTPFGIYRTPTDPVEIPLRHRCQTEWFPSGTHALHGLKARELVARLNREGCLEELLALAEFAARGWPGTKRAEENKDLWEQVDLELIRSLEKWGARLDPVPDRYTVSRRVDWLWDQAKRHAPSSVHAFYRGRLLEELPPSDEPTDDRVRTLVAVRRILESSNPSQQRLGAQVAGHQGMQDLTLAALLLQRSLESSIPMVRDASAQASAKLWPDFCFSIWWEALARGKPQARLAAVKNFRDYGDPRSVDYLIYVLSTTDRKSPQRYELNGRKVQVVKESKDFGFPLIGAYAGGRCTSATLYAISPDTDRFEHSSVLRAISPDQDLRYAITETLVKLTGEGRERSWQDWLKWYQEQYAPGKP